jgi:hypothetical protein
VKLTAHLASSAKVKTRWSSASTSHPSMCHHGTCRSNWNSFIFPRRKLKLAAILWVGGDSWHIKNCICHNNWDIVSHKWVYNVTNCENLRSHSGVDEDWTWFVNIFRIAEDLGASISILCNYTALDSTYLKVEAVMCSEMSVTINRSTFVFMLQICALWNYSFCVVLLYVVLPVSEWLCTESHSENASLNANSSQHIVLIKWFDCIMRVF